MLQSSVAVPRQNTIQCQAGRGPSAKPLQGLWFLSTSLCLSSKSISAPTLNLLRLLCLLRLLSLLSMRLLRLLHFIIVILIIIVVAQMHTSWDHVLAGCAQ